MHTHLHLFERVAALENLIAAGNAALRGRRLRRPGCQFLGDFEKRFIEDSFACRRGKGTHVAMRRAAEFARRYKKMLWDVRQRRTKAARVTQSVGAWVAHAEHAQSYGLRRSVLAGR